MEKWYWLFLIGALVIVYILMMARQKRQEKRSIEALNSFKVGDKVVTHIGIYGRIKRIYNTSFGKTCILEIGNTNKIDIEMDMRYIAGLDEKVMVADTPKEDGVDTLKKEEKQPLQEVTTPNATQNKQKKSKKTSKQKN